MTKTSAINRIHDLLDDNSFVEVGAYITARSTDYNMQSQETPADGVVTVVSGRELQKLNRIVMDIDQEAFMVVHQVGEVRGRGFTEMKRHLEAGGLKN